MREDQIQIRHLLPGDEAMVDAFLAPLTASSMFLRSNMRRTGLTYNGQPFEGIYLGAFDREDLRGVIAHYWNGNVLFQAPQIAVALARAVFQISDLPFKGIIGPYDQTRSVEEILNIPADYIQTLFKDVLFELPLPKLQIPENLLKVRSRYGAVFRQISILCSNGAWPMILKP